MKAAIRRISIRRTDDINNTGNVISNEIIGEREVPDSYLDEALDAAAELWFGKPMDEIVRDVMEMGRKARKEQK